MSLVNEMYFAITLDRPTCGLIIIACRKGGTSIEDLAEKFPDMIIKVPIDVFIGITDEDAAKVVDGLAPKVADKKASMEQVTKLYELFSTCDCTEEFDTSNELQSTGIYIAVSRYASATLLPPSILSRGIGWQNCIRQQACSIIVAPAVFGKDPCLSVDKKLSVEAICSSDEEEEPRDPNDVPTDFTSREAKVWEVKSKATERN